MNTWYGKSQGGVHNQGLVIDEVTGANIAVVYDDQHTALIAAAPAMLEALEAIVALHRGEFDHPSLVAQGVLRIGMGNNMADFAERAIQLTKGEPQS